MKLSFVNTRMPGINTFQIRDLRTLMRLGVSIDLYLFEIDSLDPAFRAEIAPGRAGRGTWPPSTSHAARASRPTVTDWRSWMVTR